MRQILAHIGRAFAAGVLGSVVGSIASIPLVTSIAAARPEVADMISHGFGPVLPLMIFIGLFFTIPCALLFAAPLTWRFRDRIADHPWWAALVFGVIGGASGLAVAALFEGSSRHSFVLLGGPYGAATGLAMVVMLRLTRRRVVESPPLTSIFE